MGIPHKALQLSIAATMKMVMVTVLMLACLATNILSGTYLVETANKDLCCCDINQFILHDRSIGVEAVHSEGDSRDDVGAIRLVRMVRGHSSISFEFHGSINREALWKALPSEVGQAVGVISEHWESILQNVAHHFPGKG